MINRDLDKIEIPDNIDEFIDKGINKLKREKEKRIFDKIFAEMGTNCKKKYENDFTIFSYFGS